MISFIRSPTWITPEFSAALASDGRETRFTPQQIQAFKDDKRLFLEYRKKVQNTGSSNFPTFFKASERQQLAFRNFSAMMEERLNGDEALSAHLIPKFPVGCRRFVLAPCLSRTKIHSISLCLRTSGPDAHTLLFSLLLHLVADQSLTPRSQIHARDGIPRSPGCGERDSRDGRDRPRRRPGSRHHEGRTRRRRRHRLRHGLRHLLPACVSGDRGQRTQPRRILVRRTAALSLDRGAGVSELL